MGIIITWPQWSFRMWCEKDIHQNLDDVTYSFLFIFIFYIIQKLVARYTVDFCRN